MIEQNFVNEGIVKVRLEEFLNKSLGRANYSHIEINKTPVSTRIVIHVQNPGLVIGRGGEKINKIIELLKNNYNIDNPVVEAEQVPYPDLDAHIVAKNISSWIEKGGHPKRIGNIYLQRIMSAGAIGAQIELAGKVSGERHRTEKFSAGYIKRCGNTSKELVDTAYELAVVKLGTIGVKVRIMRDMPDYLQLVHKIRDLPTSGEDKNDEKDQKREVKKSQESKKEVVAEKKDIAIKVKEKAQQVKNKPAGNKKSDKSKNMKSKETTKTEEVEKDDTSEK